MSDSPKPTGKQTGPPKSRPSRPSPRLPVRAVVAATVLALTAAGLVFVFASNSSEPESAAGGGTESVSLRPEADVPDGDPLDIEFTDVDGTTGTLRDLADGTPMVINFFASWCPPCIAEMPDFEAVSQAVGSDVGFFGLALTDRPEDSMRIIDQTGVTYPWSRDVRGDIAAAAGVTAMPSTLFISAEGEIVDVRSGAVSRSELRSLIETNLGIAA